MSEEIKVEIDGRTYLGRVEVSRDLVTVSTPYGSKTTQIGGSPAESIARILLREIVQAEKQRKDSVL
jgi:hypothetical protein